MLMFMFAIVHQEPNSVLAAVDEPNVKLEPGNSSKPFDQPVDKNP